jgi:hypothetical protein
MVSDHPGVLIVRTDGVIVVLDAVPISAELQQQIDAVCDVLGAPPRGERTEEGT